MTAIIIEDEALAARELESILKKLAPEIEIVARQDSVRGSVQWLKENQVDLIFSDVHLGDGRSFDIFGQVEIKAPVIFITAYDEYALQAFKSQGIDYILKPFDEEEILRALEKAREYDSADPAGSMSGASHPDGPISGALFGADRNEDQIRTGGRSRLFYGRWKIPDVIYP